MEDSAFVWIPGIEDDGQRRRIPNIEGGYGDDGSDRFMQAQLLTGAATSFQAAGTRESAQDEQSFGYTQNNQYPVGQIYGSSSQYQPAYLQGPINQQPFPQNASQQPLYNNVPPYRLRQPTAAEIVPKRFNFPQSSPARDDRRVSGLGIMPQQYPTPLYQQRLHNNPTTDLEHPTLASSDPRTDLDFPQAAGDHYDYVYSQLMRTNENTSRGRLVAAAESLFEISEWLCSHAAGLGLAQDDQGLHDRRLKLWEDFNHCWLALLQRQLDDTQKMRESQQELGGAQNTLSNETLQGLGDRITSQCDKLEKLGLVDYQMGVWEEQIVDMLIECIDILARDDDGDDDNTVGQGKGRDNARTLLSGSGRQMH